MSAIPDPTPPNLAPLTIRLIRQLSQARRERDLAIELLTHATNMLGIVERQRDTYREKYYRLLDERQVAA